MADGILTPVVWHVALESWQWIYQVAAPCNVKRDSGMRTTCHWIRQVAAPCDVACSSGIMTVNLPSGSILQCDTWLWHVIEFVWWQHPVMWHPAMWQVAHGWHAIEFAQTSAILEIYIWFRFRPYHRSRHVILHQSAKFYPNRTTLGRKNDVMSIFKMADLCHLGF